MHSLSIMQIMLLVVKIHCLIGSIPFVLVNCNVSLLKIQISYVKSQCELYKSVIARQIQGQRLQRHTQPRLRTWIVPRRELYLPVICIATLSAVDVVTGATDKGRRAWIAPFQLVGEDNPWPEYMQAWLTSMIFMHKPAAESRPEGKALWARPVCRVMWQECSNWRSFLHPPTHRRLTSYWCQLGSCMDAKVSWMLFERMSAPVSGNPWSTFVITMNIS